MKTRGGGAISPPTVIAVYYTRYHHWNCLNDGDAQSSVMVPQQRTGNKE